MTNFSHEQNTPIDRFFTLHDQQDLITAQLETAGPATAELLRRAHARADNEIRELVDYPDVMDVMGQTYEPYVVQSLELDTLEPLLDAGLLEADEISERRAALGAEYVAKPQFEIVTRHVQGYATALNVLDEMSFDDLAPANQTMPEVDDIAIEYGSTYADDLDEGLVGAETQNTLPAHSVKIDLVPTEVDLEGSTDASETLRPKLRLTRRDNNLIIGADQEIVPLDISHNRKGVDATEERYGVVEILAANSPAFIPVHEIWTTGFPHDEPTLDVKDEVRHWLQQDLRIDGNPIFVSNGKRGLGSKWGFPNYTVELGEDGDVSINDSDLLESPFEPAPELSVDNLAEQELEDYFPLEMFESEVVAEFLRINKPYLHELGLNDIDPSVFEILDERPVSDQKGGLSAYDNDIRVARGTSLQKLRDFFTDEDKVLDALDHMQSDDPRLPLFTYFFDLGTSKRWETLDALTNAKQGVISTTNIARRSPQQVLDTASFTELPDGTRITRTRTTRTTSTTDTATVTTEEFTPVSREEQIGSLVLPEMVGFGSSTTVELEPDVDVTEIAAPDKKIANSQLQEFEESAAAKLQEFLEYVQTHNLTNRNPSGLQAHFNWLTSSFVGSSKGILSRDGLSFSEQDLLMMWAKHEFPNEWGVANSKVHPSRRTIERTIRQVLKDSKADSE